MGCARCWFGFFVQLEIWAFICWTAVLVCKVDEIFNYDWILVFVPFWASVPAFFPATYIIMNRSYRYNYKRPSNWWGGLIWIWLIGLGTIVWTVLLALKLDTILDIAWWFVFVPAWVALLSLYLVDSDWPEFKFTFRYEFLRYDKLVQALFAVLPQHVTTSMLVFSVILVIHLEDIYTIPWWLLYMPFWWLIVLVLIIHISLLKLPIGDGNQYWVAALILICPVAFIILLGLKLMGVIQTYLALVWIPLWILETIAFFIAFGAPCYFS